MNNEKIIYKRVDDDAATYKRREASISRVCITGAELHIL